MIGWDVKPQQSHPTSMAPKLPGSLFLFQIVKRIIEQKQEKYQKVYPGLTCFKDGVRQIPIESIPGLQESGWKPPVDKV